MDPKEMQRLQAENAALREQMMGLLNNQTDASLLEERFHRLGKSPYKVNTQQKLAMDQVHRPGEPREPDDNAAESNIPDPAHGCAQPPKPKPKPIAVAIQSYDGIENGPDGRIEEGYLCIRRGDRIEVWPNSTAPGHAGNRHRFYTFGELVNSSGLNQGWFPEEYISRPVNDEMSNAAQWQ